MGALVVDANVIIAYLLRDNALHAIAQSALATSRARGDTFVLPASVLSESMVGGFRNGTSDELRRRIVALFGPVRTMDEEIALAAAELRARHRSLRLPDALVVATGVVDRLPVLTCDRRLGAVHPSVQVLVA
jgi:predicted nucleic acid-binding protein